MNDPLEEFIKKLLSDPEIGKEILKDVITDKYRHKIDPKINSDSLRFLKVLEKYDEMGVIDKEIAAYCLEQYNNLLYTTLSMAISKSKHGFDPEENRRYRRTVNVMVSTFKIQASRTFERTLKDENNYFHNLYLTQTRNAIEELTKSLNDSIKE